eukprot:CAMPEP_0198143540 /NCGR_PEP_ID=MMETSP1443-20131203/8527_1 /TAXON_ID=186043 /ORGANISM="Entomoneis sp., Strain CCMP2396" /LENGTH=247 /DNA_ID=CAMNT_0043806791 /DNA_START=172 /DNA_END=918 /DNA_ORIENTATION=-
MSTTTGGAADDSMGKADIGNTASAGNNYATDEAEKSWRQRIQISSDRSRKVRGSNYVQIATVDHETNAPRCRTVVFRGFQDLPEGHLLSNRCSDMSCVMKMITDSRSQKVREVTNHPDSAAELVWWFPKTSEQYRVSGKLLFIGAGAFTHDPDEALQAARKQQWGNLSDSARESFLDTQIPGGSYSGKPSEVPSGGRDEDGKVVPPPDNFLLMLLFPKSVDFLRLTNMYKQADNLQDGNWSMQRLNP